MSLEFLSDKINHLFFKKNLLTALNLSSELVYLMNRRYKLLVLFNREGN